MPEMYIIIKDYAIESVKIDLACNNQAYVTLHLMQL